MKWERYIAGLLEHGLLKAVILILSLGLVAEGIFLMKMSHQQRIVLVPPGIGQSQEIWVGQDSAGPRYLKEMTWYLLPLVASFHPRNLDVQLGLFLHYVSPEQYGEVKTRLLAQAKRVGRNDLAQVFYIQEMSVENQTVRATGILERFMGKIRTSEEVATYEVRYAIRNGRPVVVGIDRVPGHGVGPSNRVRPRSGADENEQPGSEPDLTP